MRYLTLLLFAIAAVGISSQPFSCYPRMTVQPSIKPFEQEMPEMPRYLVPFGGRPAFPTTRARAVAFPNPVKGTPQAIQLGGIYYGYYCSMCHGEKADGWGAVRQSYVPEPSDLTGPKAQALTDGELALAMVSGTGHEPVLDSTVPVERRWMMVHYLRSLGSARR